MPRIDEEEEEEEEPAAGGSSMKIFSSAVYKRHRNFRSGGLRARSPRNAIRQRERKREDARVALTYA